jgi:hypothetical protein
LTQVNNSIYSPEGRIGQHFIWLDGGLCGGVDHIAHQQQVADPGESLTRSRG